MRGPPKPTAQTQPRLSAGSRVREYGHLAVMFCRANWNFRGRLWVSALAVERATD